MAGELEGWRTRAKADAYIQQQAHLNEAERQSLADSMLLEAYRSVFATNDPHVQMVLADLAAFSGFYQVAHPDVTDVGHVLRREGKREVFARIWSFLTINERGLSDFEEAARSEAAASLRGDLD